MRNFKMITKHRNQRRNYFFLLFVFRNGPSLPMVLR